MIPLSQTASTANHLISCWRCQQHPRYGKDLRKSLWIQTEVSVPGLFGRIAFQDACGATEIRCRLLQIRFSVSDIRHRATSCANVDLWSSWYHYFTLTGKALMGPEYDNASYREVRPFSIENFMKTVKVEDLGGAFFNWEDKTLKQ